MKIGVMVDSLRIPVREGIKKAREIGAQGMQMHAVSGETAPEALKKEDRRDLKQLVSDNGLEICALCGDLGGHGFQRADENIEKIVRSKAIVDLAVDLGVSVITTHIGVVPENGSDPVYETMLYACRDIAAYATERKISFAVETGPETPQRLRRFLDDVDSAGMGANYDPANLIMVLDADPAAGVGVLDRHIVHTHAKDGVHLAACDPVKVYEAFAAGGIDGFDFGRYFNEVPLGAGSVDWDAYLEALRSIGYDGYLTIEREVGEDPIADITAAVRFIEDKIR